MHRNLAAIAGALTLVSGALLVSDSAQAGASASAPSKYSRTTTQTAANQGQNKRNDFGITEYSSSSARNHQH